MLFSCSSPHLNIVQSSEKTLSLKFLFLLPLQSLKSIMNVPNFLATIVLDLAFILCLGMGRFSFVLSNGSCKMFYPKSLSKTPVWKIQFVFSYNNINPLKANFTKWSNTLEQFVSRLPTRVCLTILWDRRLKSEHFLSLSVYGSNQLFNPLPKIITQMI